MRVLYVEDSADDAALVRRVLERHAPHIVLDTVATVREARAHLAAPDGCDLVVTDLTLPDGDGIDLVAAIRRESLRLAVVVLTGTTEFESAVAALKAGADDYLVKRGDFRDRLPAVLDGALARFRAGVLQHPPAIRVLYAEDSAHDVQLTRRHFNRNAHHMLCDVVDAVPALLAQLSSAALAGVPYDVVLLDYRLGTGSGLDAIKALGEDTRQDIPVIVVSGHADADVAALAFRFGASDFVVKQPGYLFRLTGAIETACYRREIQRDREALRSSERLFFDLFEFAPDAFIITDRRGIMTMVNGRAEEIFGWTRTEMVGQAVETLIPTTAAAGHQALRGRYTSEPSQPRVMGAGRDLRAIHKDGHALAVEISLSPMTVGGVPVYAAAIRDITERKELEAKFLQAQKMETLGRLVGGIAHDFNNMLTVIKGTAEMAADRVNEEDPLARDIAVIDRAGEKASALTQQLLAFSRKQVLQPSVIDAGAVVNGLVAILDRVVGEAVEVVVRTEVAPLPIRVDPGQFEQVLMNLAVNARDAMPEGGRLTIEVRRVRPDDAFARARPLLEPGSYVMLIVSDTGVGMHESILQKVFDPFFTTKARGAGTGLGLSTVHGIVKQSGGDIEASSEEGHGTTFCVYFPKTAMARRDAPATPLPHAAGGQETILVVDDDRDVRDLVARILDRVGYTVLTADGGTESLTVLARHRGPVHLLLTDVVMRGMDGRELAQRFVDRVPSGRVIYASGYTDDDILRHGVMTGQVPFVTKPFSTEVLLRTVRDVLDSPDASGGLPRPGAPARRQSSGTP